MTQQVLKKRFASKKGQWLTRTSDFKSGLCVKSDSWKSSELGEGFGSDPHATGPKLRGDGSRSADTELEEGKSIQGPQWQLK